MKRMIFEILFFIFWCVVFMVLMFKLIKSCESQHRKLNVKTNQQIQKIQVQNKKFKFEEPKDWFEDKSISQRKLETIDRIFEFRTVD